MGIGLLFWILMILWLVLGFWQVRTPTGWNYPVLGVSVIIFILLGLLGYHAFGAPLR